MKRTANAKSIMKALERLGFILVRTKGDHFVYKKDGFSTQVPYHSGNRSVPLGTINLICKNGGITKRELFDCI